MQAEWRRSAPANTNPDDIRTALAGLADDWEAATERQPIIRTGTRTPLCWHLRSMVKRRDNWTCRWCGIDAQQRELQLDHITPWSAGGPHDTRNLQVLCEKCNTHKSNRLDPIRRTAPGVVIECIRCRTPNQPPNGDTVWCFTCQTFSHDATAWTDLAQRFLLEHCDQILRPKAWNREVATYERDRLTQQWRDWAPQAAADYERQLRDTLAGFVAEWRQVRAITGGTPSRRETPSPTTARPGSEQARVTA